MKALLALALVLALVAGCYVHARPEFDYGTCFAARWPIPACDPYYEWIPGYATIDNVVIDGYYRLRPGFHEEWRDHRIFIRTVPPVVHGPHKRDHR